MDTIHNKFKLNIYCQTLKSIHTPIKYKSIDFNIKELYKNGDGHKNGDGKGEGNGIGYGKGDSYGSGSGSGYGDGCGYGDGNGSRNI